MIPEVINTQSDLGWTPNQIVDNELSDLLATAAPNAILEVAGSYRTLATYDLQKPDGFKMIGVEEGAGFTRSGDLNNSLFLEGEGCWTDGITVEAEGWEESDEKQLRAFEANGRSGLRYTRVNLLGRNTHGKWVDCPGLEFVDYHNEGGMWMNYLVGRCDNARFIECTGTGGYLDPNNLQGDWIKTGWNPNYEGPVGGLVLGGEVSTLRNAADSTGGLKDWIFAHMVLRIKKDEAFDLKSAYASMAILEAVLASGTGLNTGAQFLYNTYIDCVRGINATTDYKAMAAGLVSQAQHEAARCGDLLSLGETFINEAFTGNMAAIKNTGSGLIEVRDPTFIGKMNPYQEGNALGNQGYRPVAAKFKNVGWDGQWRAPVSIYGDEFEFEFGSLAVLKNVTSGLFMFQAANDLAGLTLAGTAQKHSSSTASITPFRTQGHTVDPINNTMTIN